MNLGQLLGPLVGGALYQYGGFYLPFLSMGALQACMGIVSIVSMKEIPGKCFLMQICLTIKIEDLTLNWSSNISIISHWWMEHAIY